MEASQLIFDANHLTGFTVMVALTLNDLTLCSFAKVVLTFHQTS